MSGVAQEVKQRVIFWKGRHTRVVNMKRFFSRLKGVTPIKLRLYLNNRIVYAIDVFKDKRITGENLTRTVPAPLDLTNRGTESQPAKYLILKK